jgi:hypothetical protein
VPQGCHGLLSLGSAPPLADDPRVEFYRSDEVPDVDCRVVFRDARWPPLVGGLILVGWAAVVSVLLFPAAWGFGWVARTAAVVVAGPFLALLAGMGFMFLQNFRLSGRPANWLLRHGRDGLLLNLRSWQNAHLPEPHETVAFIPTGDVALVRGSIQEHVRPNRRGTVRGGSSHLELVLLGVDLASLEDLLEKERTLPAAGGRIVKSRSRHQPVSVPEAGVLRLAWSGSSGRIRPKLEPALAILAESHGVLSAERSETDFRKLEGSALEDHLLQLAEAGDIMSATTIARRCYGMSMTEAKGFVDGLRGTGET